MPVTGLNFISSVVCDELKQIAFYRELLINSNVIFGTNGQFENLENDFLKRPAQIGQIKICNLSEFPKT